MKTLKSNIFNTAKSGHIKDLRPEKKKMALLGTSIAITSGVVLWKNYSSVSVQEKSKDVVDDFQPQFIDIKQNIGLMPPQDLKTMIPRHLRKPWKLMHKANHGNREDHLNAVRELSTCTQILGNGEAREMAQCLEMRTAVGLARMPESDLRLFLPSPPSPKEVKESSIPIQFYTILSKLPSTKDVHQCIRYFTTTALQGYIQQLEDDFVQDDDLNVEFHRDTHLIMELPMRNRHSVKQVIEYCLVAILSHSTIKSHCQNLVENTNLLPLLLRIAQDFPDNLRLISLIGKIIANISLFSETHQSIYASGWVGVLAQWVRNPNILISLPATKALANLDQDYGQCSYAPGIYLVLPNDRVVKHKNELSNQGVDVVLLHGLLGGVFYTWRQHDRVKRRSWSDLNLVSGNDYSFCWPRDWLCEDGLDDRVRVIGVDFDAYVSQWGNSCPRESFSTSLADRSKDLLDKLRKCGIGQRPVIFVGHSMGGLVAKKMLLQAQAEQDHEFVRNTKGMMFYSTPHLGSGVAKLNSPTKFLFFPSTEVCDLEEDSPQLTDLNQNFIQLAKDKKDLKVVSFGESLPTPMFGIDMNFVSRKSADLGIGEYYQIKTNHINICKPESKDSIIYRKFLDMVMDVVDDNII